MSLNEQQKKAAANRHGHAIVLAGPGTGKTLTLVARHAFLRSTGSDPDDVMVVTFTKEAAEELKQKLSKFVSRNAWIGTFHAICLRILRKFSEQAELRRNFKVLDPGAQKILLASLGIVWDADDGDLTDIIGRWKDSLISPDEADAEAARRNSVPLRNAAAHYTAYQDEMRRRGDLDFADLVARATELVSSVPGVRAWVAERIRHCLVDEFQDVNRAQVEFLQALAATGTTVWAVADDDQSLYAWRGGNVRYTVKFSEFFEGARYYVLIQNYRCDPVIVAAANSVIANNRQRVSKRLEATKPHRPNVSIRVRAFKSEREEGVAVASAIARMKAAGAPLKDVAILFRTSSVTPVIQQELQNRGIPFRLSGATGFWELPEVRAVADMISAIEHANLKAGYRFRGGTDLVETMKGSPPSETAGAVARLVGDQPPQGSNGERAAAWSDACYAAAEIARSFGSSAEFSAHLEEMAASATSPEEEGVAVSTVHASKGLEWKHVFVCGCEASLMPHVKAEDPEEERRLFYVALTRTKGSIDLCFSRQRFGKSQNPSPFLSEMARGGAVSVQWIGEDAMPAAAGAGSGRTQEAAPASDEAPSGRLKIYRRKGGGRSLVPPEERDQ